MLIGTSNLLQLDRCGDLRRLRACWIGVLVPRGLHGTTAKKRAVEAAETEAPAGKIQGIAADEPVVEPAHGGDFLGDAREGIAFIARDPVLAGTTLQVVLVTNMLDAGFGAGGCYRRI